MVVRLGVRGREKNFNLLPPSDSEGRERKRKLQNTTPYPGCKGKRLKGRTLL